jgi:hypothetical protein
MKVRNIKMMNLEQLINQVQQITASGLPFMEGKEKLEVKGNILNNVLTVDEYGFLEGEEGEYVVIALKEYPQHFIYGSSVVTQAFKTLEETLDEEERAFILDKGLTFKLTEVVSKNKRKYIKLTFFPKN